MRWARYGALFFILGCLTLPGNAAITPTDLRREYLADPAGIDIRDLRFFWQLVSNQADQEQRAYHVLVASQPDLLEKDQGDMFDSGKVASAENTHLVYADQPLSSAMDYFWKVRVWDRDHTVSAWSEVARFFTGHALWELMPKSGYADLTFDVALNTAYPGYGYMLERGATTVWEHWTDGSSHMHYFKGYVDNFLYRYVAGLNVDATSPGFRTILFTPKLMHRLDHAHANYDSIHGMECVPVIAELPKSAGMKAICTISVV